MLKLNFINLKKNKLRIFITTLIILIAIPAAVYLVFQKASYSFSQESSIGGSVMKRILVADDDSSILNIISLLSLPLFAFTNLLVR